MALHDWSGHWCHIFFVLGYGKPKDDLILYICSDVLRVILIVMEKGVVLRG